MLPRPLEYLLTIVLFLTILTGLYGPVLFRQKAFPPNSVNDLRTTGPSLAHLRTEAFETARSYRTLLARVPALTLPLWDPFVGVGRPLAANPDYGAFAPMNLPLLVAHVAPRSDILGVIRLAVAGLFLLFFMFRLGVGMGGSLLAAVGYCASGHAVHFADHPVMNAYMFLPAMLLATDMLVANPAKVWPSTALALAWACVILGGAPLALLLTSMIVVLYFLWRLALCKSDDHQMFSFESVWYFGRAAAFALGLTLFVLIPWAEWRLSDPDLLEPMGAEGIDTLFSPLALFSPHLFHSYADQAHQAPLYWFTALLVLAAWAVGDLSNRNRILGFFILLAGVSTALLADCWPVGRNGQGAMLSQLIASEHASPFFLALAVLAGVGLDNLSRRRRLTGLAAPLLILLFLTFSLLLWRALSHLPQRPTWAEELSLNHLERVGAMMLLFLTITLILAYAAARHGTMAHLLSALLALVALGEIITSFPAHWPEPAGKSETRPVLEDLERRTLQNHQRVLSINGALPRRDASRHGLFLIEQTLPTGRALQERSDWDLMGAQFVVAPTGTTMDEAQPSGKFYQSRETPRLVLENRMAYPRAWFVPAMTGDKMNYLLDSEATSQSLQDARSIDLQRQVFLEGPLARRHATFLEKNAATRFRSPEYPLSDILSAFEITDFRANRIDIEGQALGGPGWLVVADRHYPGWQVFVDGKWDKVYRANGVFRAAFLEPGVRQVTFIYIPWTFWAGLALSLLTALQLIRSTRKPRTTLAGYGPPSQFVLFR